jgi:hypothetical protein
MASTRYRREALDAAWKKAVAANWRAPAQQDVKNPPKVRDFRGMNKVTRN